MKYITKGVLLTANLQDDYNFPFHRACADLRPDIVWWDDGKRVVTSHLVIACTDLCPDIVWWDDGKREVTRVNHSFRHPLGGGSFEEERQVCRSHGSIKRAE